ncbi:creatinine amidohydrolase, partial [mine drainage metagenome]
MLPPPHRLSDLDSRSLERVLPRRPLLILPVGALEAHGPHLPLGADLIQAEATADALAERLDALVAPGLAYGVCPGTRRFPGSVSRSLEGLSREVREILGEFFRQGFRRVLVLSGHGDSGHMAALREGARQAAEDHPGLAVAA